MKNLIFEFEQEKAIQLNLKLKELLYLTICSGSSRTNKSKQKTKKINIIAGLVINKC